MVSMKWMCASGAIVGLLVACSTTPPGGTGQSGTREKVDFAVAQKIIQQRCTSCHSTKPTRPGITSAPNGVTFDKPADIKKMAEQIRLRAVLNKTMPPDPSEMSNEERQQLGAWILAGADTGGPSPQPLLPASGVPTVVPLPSSVSTPAPTAFPATPVATPVPLASTSGVPFAVAQKIVQQRCSGCHSFAQADQMKAKAAQIKTRAVVEKNMPQQGSAQAAQITEEERRLLGEWVDNGASTN